MRAQLADGRPVAGKTGTTENYGDAWFVGYTPQLAVAVWVGYPNKLSRCRPSSTASPVAGGTFPALIFKTFMEKALPYLNDEPEVVPVAEFPLAGDRERRLPRRASGSATTATARGTISVVFFSGEGPARLANCKPNEVEVPNVLGDHSTTRPRSSRTGRCAPQPIYKPAQPGQRVGVVVGQIPSIGSHLAPFDTVRLVLAKPLHGVVPSVVGPDARPQPSRSWPRAGSRSRSSATLADGTGSGRVISQAPLAGVAAAPGMTVTLVVTPAEIARAGEAVAPRQLGGARDADPRAGDDLDRLGRAHGARTAARRAAGRRGAPRDRRAPGRAGPGPEQSRRGSSSPRRSRISSSPSVGSSARTSTASGLPSSAQTRFRHQWMPYER